MSKRLKVIGLIIFGCIILIVSFLSIRYVIHSDGDKDNVDADYVSIDKVEDVYEESQGIIHDTIEKESLAEGIQAVKLKTQDDEAVDEYEEVNEAVIKNEGISEESVEGMISNEGASEENVEETVSNEEPNEEVSVTDVAALDDEIMEYTGDEYIDTRIHEHRDEIADEDIIFMLSIADRIDSNVIFYYMEEGLTDEEREELSDYLHSILTEAEYAKLKELFYKYNYILE